MSAAGASLARYARQIERTWSSHVARPVVLSARDWRRIENWYERGVPLSLVLECIAAVFERRRSGAADPRGLGYVSSAVEEAWSVVVDGRRGSAGAEPGNDDEVRAIDENGTGPTGPSAAEVWRRRAAAAAEGAPLRLLLEDLLARLDRGEPEDRIDEALDRALPDLIDRAANDEIRRAVRRETEHYDRRLDRETLGRARDRIRRRKIRRRLGLPRLVAD